MQDVDGLGAAGNLVKVNHGYARNFLVPNKLAAVRRGKQSGSVAGLEDTAAEASAARASVPSSALSEEDRKQHQLESQRRQLALVVKKLTTQTLVSKEYSL